MSEPERALDKGIEADKVAAELGCDPDVARAAAEILKQRVLPSELPGACRNRGPWLWQGYLGPGRMTLLTSQWKSGKTTMVSLLLKRMETGGQLAGLAVAAGRAAVVTEESEGDWELRYHNLHLANNTTLFPLPFKGKPNMVQWRGLVQAMLYLRRQEGLSLVVIDPLSIFMPGNNENSAAAVMDCLLPLRELTAAGLAVLLLHHPRKGPSMAGQSSRGSGALPSHVDTVIEMTWYGHGDQADRRRWLRAYSRYEETRRNLIVELTADGRDYLTHDPAGLETGGECWELLHQVLEDASDRLTQRQIRDEWPEDFRKPDIGTLSRTLQRAVDQGKVRRDGTGRKNDPRRYWLAGKEDDFFPGQGAPAEELERWRQRQNAKWLEVLRRMPPRRPAAPTAAAGGGAADAQGTTLPAAAGTRQAGSVAPVAAANAAIEPVPAAAVAGSASAAAKVETPPSAAETAQPAPVPAVPAGETAPLPAAAANSPAAAAAAERAASEPAAPERTTEQEPPESEPRAGPASRYVTNSFGIVVIPLDA
jgi:hypothetical protein